MEKTGGATHWTPFPAERFFFFFGESFTGGILGALLTAAGNVVTEEKPIQSRNVYLLPLEYTS